MFSVHLMYKMKARFLYLVLYSTDFWTLAFRTLNKCNQESFIFISIGIVLQPGHSIGWFLKSVNAVSVTSH